jgi:ribulose-phosphate 3-epimerase
MTFISPSILSCDFLNFETDIKRFDSAKDIWFHLDIMDGHYVPNLTFGKTILKDLHKVTTHTLDAHFMVANPEDYVKEYSDIGIHNFSFHWEAVTHHDRMISFVKDHYKSVGIAINPGTPVESIPTYIIEKIDLILIMSVNPGFGGQSFIESSIEKVKYFKNLKDIINPCLVIQVDGGVKESNAKELIKAGATNLVAGSYIFNEPKQNYLQQINNLR